MLPDCQRDVFDLDKILHRPGAQFMVGFGRQRVGKTTLLLEWVRHSELPFFYGVAIRSPPCSSRSRTVAGGSATRRMSSG